MTKKEFYVNPSAAIVFVSDFFKDDLIGGAELTHDAILNKCPVKFDKIHSSSVTPEMVEANKHKTWLLGNISQMDKASLITVARETKFSLIECDYLYCIFRSSHLHKLQTGNPCDCHQQDSGRFVQSLFKRSQGVHFMSEGQKTEYLRLFPALTTIDNKLWVQGSTFSDFTLDKLQALQRGRAAGIPIKENTWAVLGGGTWIKNQASTEAWCKAGNKTYEVIGGGISPELFLQKLSTYHGLVFHPAGFDTAPRLTIEAKVMGLELDLNDNVQHRQEPWFAGDRETCLIALQNRADLFWQRLNMI